VNNPKQHVFVVLNPKAGNSDLANDIHMALEKYFPTPEWTTEIYEMTGDEDIAALCRDSCERGACLVVAAGGDGTLVSVANGLVDSHIPLGVLPLGTGNDLARILGIPLKLQDALELLAGDHDVIEVDALKVGKRYFLSNVSVGISPHVMKDTKPEQKKRFGRLAYLWTLVRQSSIFRLHRYRLTIDGQSHVVRAAEVMVSNTTLLEELPSLFGPPKYLNDAYLEVYMVTARTWREYLQMAWDLIRRRGKSATKLYHLGVKRSIGIETYGSPQLVQADGEVIGRTPVEVELVPKALHVIMPKAATDSTTQEVDHAVVQE
jgi:diacylglycerol kinase (ATP)